MKANVLKSCAIIIAICVWTSGVYSVGAAESSSTSFYSRNNVRNVSAGTSSSTSFKLLFGADADANGVSSSTSFKVMFGLLRGLFQPMLDYHWRNDDGSESTATSATGGAQDTPLATLAKNSQARLRIGVANTGGTIKGYATQQFRLEYGLRGTTCAAISSWTNIAGSTEWATSTTANLTDSANTTNIAIAIGGVTDGNHAFLATNGGVRTLSNQTGALSVPSDTFAEFEYGIKALAGATDGATYCFRVTNAGSATNFSYTNYPQVTLASGSQTISMSFSPATVTLPGLTPGVAVLGTTTVSVSITGGTAGYSLKINRNGASATLSSSSITFPDYTAWNPGTGCSAGQGNGTTTPGATFSFRVQQANITSSYCSSWWGANDTAGTALYAGTPTASQTIMNCATCNSGSTNTEIKYRVDAPNSQKSTNYSGVITFTALANP